MTEIECGLLTRGKVRGMLQALKLYGHIEDFTEARGWLISTFYILKPNKVALENFRDWHKTANRSAA